jgi:hypothetical protein
MPGSTVEERRELLEQLRNYDPAVMAVYKHGADVLVHGNAALSVMFSGPYDGGKYLVWRSNGKNVMESAERLVKLPEGCCEIIKVEENIGHDLEIWFRTGPLGTALVEGGDAGRGVNISPGLDEDDGRDDLKGTNLDQDKNGEDKGEKKHKAGQ